MKIAEMLMVATDRNIVVYDVEAPDGYITDRLIDLLKLAMLDNPMINEKDRENTNRKGATLHTIWVDEKWITESAKSPRMFRFRDGIKLVRPVEFNMTEYYLTSCKGCLVKDDKFIGLGIGAAVLDDGTTQEEYMLVSI